MPTANLKIKHGQHLQSQLDSRRKLERNLLNILGTSKKRKFINEKLQITRGHSLTEKSHTKWLEFHFICRNDQRKVLWEEAYRKANKFLLCSWHMSHNCKEAEWVAVVCQTKPAHQEPAGEGQATWGREHSAACRQEQKSINEVAFLIQPLANFFLFHSSTPGRTNIRLWGLVSILLDFIACI